MAFQPFGYEFEVRSHLPVKQFKATLRARLKSWFEPTLGALGWIAGPFICLWLTASDPRGPMLIGRIVDDSFGAKITGRAGSDLNGLLFVAAMLPYVAQSLFSAVMAASYRSAIIPALMLILVPYFLWRLHKERLKAEPLVSFLEDAATRPEPSLRAKAEAVKITRRLTLSIGGIDQDTPPTFETIRQAVLSLSNGGFLVLSAGAETYMQALRDGDSYRLEMREGHRDRHYRAERRGPSGGRNRAAFAADEVLAILMAYGADSVTPSFLRWTLITV